MLVKSQNFYLYPTSTRSCELCRLFLFNFFSFFQCLWYWYPLDYKNSNWMEITSGTRNLPQRQKSSTLKIVMWPVKTLKTSLMKFKEQLAPTLDHLLSSVEEIIKTHVIDWSQENGIILPTYFKGMYVSYQVCSNPFEGQIILHFLSFFYKQLWLPFIYLFMQTNV